VKTDHLPSQLHTVDLPKFLRLISVLYNAFRQVVRTLRQVSTPLLVETFILAASVIFAIRLFSRSPFSAAGWFVVPAVLAATAIAPAIVKRTGFVSFGLRFKQLKSSLKTLGLVCLLVFPAMFGFLWILKSHGLSMPLQPVLAKNQNWIAWLLYQFMYVAVAEEMFFRGYVQNNILSILGIHYSTNQRPCQWISIIISAAIFAIAHVVVMGQIISVLTFFPGLVLGWLFIRTKSLSAPILFHVMANVCYLVMSTSLA
jgi:membrane protease YdiL (CAAX protease family)